MALNVKFYFGSQAKYDALAEKNAHALYFIEDTQRIYKGDVLIASGANASSLASGLMSSEDKIKLDSLSSSGSGGTGVNFTPVDGTIVIESGENSNTIGVAISSDKGNALIKKDDGLYVGTVSFVSDYTAGNGIDISDNNISVKIAQESHGLKIVDGAMSLALATSESDGAMSKEDKDKLDKLSLENKSYELVPVDGTIVLETLDTGKNIIGVSVSKSENNSILKLDDGLYVAPHPLYSIEKQDIAEDGYCTTYKLKQTVGEEESYVGNSINVPRDLVVQTGHLGIVTEDNIPYEGAVVGETYLDIVLNEPSGQHIYVPAKDMIDTSDFATKEEIQSISETANDAKESFTWEDM